MRRSFLEYSLDTLAHVEDCEGIKTRVTQRANLNSSKMKEVLSYLEDCELVKNKSGLLLLTVKGKEVKRAWKTISQALRK